MPALNFQPRFVRAIELDLKRQTIRAKRKDGRDPKMGDLLYLYVGLRTKAVRSLGGRTCYSVEGIEIWSSSLVQYRGIYLDPDERESLAHADGFSTWAEMFDFFKGRLPFCGLLIRW